MTDEDLYDLYSEAGLTQREEQLMAEYLDFNDDFYGSSSYEKLYGYFYESGEMPYGVAKARDGDPAVWILDYLERCVQITLRGGIMYCNHPKEI